MTSGYPVSTATHALGSADICKKEDSKTHTITHSLSITLMLSMISNGFIYRYLRKISDKISRTQFVLKLSRAVK